MRVHFYYTAFVVSGTVGIMKTGLTIPVVWLSLLKLTVLRRSALLWNRSFGDVLCCQVAFWIFCCRVGAFDIELSQISFFLYARLVGTYYGMAMASGRPSVCGFVRKVCKHDTDWTVPARTFKLGTLTTYDKRTNPHDFQGKGSKVKVTITHCF